MKVLITESRIVQGMEFPSVIIIDGDPSMHMWDPYRPGQLYQDSCNVSMKVMNFILLFERVIQKCCSWVSYSYNHIATGMVTPKQHIRCEQEK